MIKYDAKFFNIKDTLECGQIFRFKPYKDGYLVFSTDKACYAYPSGEYTVIEADDEEYFEKFFDLGADYSLISGFAKNCGYKVVERAATLAEGIRILCQDREEMLFSFIISQNNNIPRIKSTIEKTCLCLGEKKTFMGQDYYAFPKSERFSEKDEDFYKQLGYGYRAGYTTAVASALNSGFNLDKIAELNTEDLKKELLSLKGVGPKVADCVSLFGYHRTDSFPVDTWIEKLYREDFGGKETDRNKITSYFLNLFGEKSGYVQQYIFYYKRSLENKKGF